MIKKDQTLLHFVGIGGIGMSGIAEVFLNQGYRVSGSDIHDSPLIHRLQKLGAQIQIGHRAQNVQGAHVVVFSSAVKNDNPEMLEAKRLRIPTIPRAEMLGELMRGKTGVAVAGSHGKTTTTSMIATLFSHAGLDPTVVIGGRLDLLGGSNAKLGQGQYVVAEADESDGSFLHLPATLGVVTNIDNDHLDYYKTISAIDHAFVEFVGKLPFYGLAAVCGEDLGVRRCLARMTKPVVTYGFSEEWDVFPRNLVSSGLSSRFEIWHRDSFQGVQCRGTVEIHVPGRHNVLNALAAYIIADSVEIPFDKIAEGLKAYAGVKRRFEIRWKNEPNQQVIVDDYGHHPTEIAATLQAAKNYWPGRVITVFQPHRYSRTLHCWDGFKSAFQNSDLTFITDIYSAGEEPIDGISAEALAKEISAVAPSHHEVQFVGSLSQAKVEVLKRLSKNDLVLCLGAGSITRLPDELMEELSSGV